MTTETTTEDKLTLAEAFGAEKASVAETTATNEVDNKEQEAPQTSEEGNTSTPFDNYFNQLSPESQELFKKNGVDSFEKQEKWVSGLNSLIGKKGLINPGENASEEQKAEYKNTILNELGRPENGEYKFDVSEKIPEQHINQEFLDGLAKLGYESGLNNEGFQNLINHIYSGYEKTVSYINDLEGKIKEMGSEGTLDDRGSVNPAVTKATVHEQAKDMSIKAREAFNKGDFKTATNLQEQAKEMYNKLALLK